MRDFTDEEAATLLPTAAECDAFDAMMTEHWRIHCWPLSPAIWGVRNWLIDTVNPCPSAPSHCVAPRVSP